MSRLRLGRAMRGLSIIVVLAVGAWLSTAFARGHGGSEEIEAPVFGDADSVLIVSDSVLAVIRRAVASAGTDRPLRVAHLGDSHSEQGGFGAELATRWSGGGVVAPAFVTPYSRNLNLVRLRLSAGWQRSTWRQGAVGKIEGPSGSAAITARSTATMRLELPRDMQGTSRMTVWWTGPSGTAFSLRAGSLDRRVTRRVAPGDTGPLQRTEVLLPSGTTEVVLDRVRLPRNGRLRIGGFTFERDDATISYDLLGLGATTHRHPLNREAGSLSQFLQARDHDIVLLWYGTNSVRERPFDAARIQREYTALLALVRRHAPRAALIMVGPPDLEGLDQSCAPAAPARPRNSRSRRRPVRPAPPSPPPIACPVDSAAAATDSGTASRGSSAPRRCPRVTHPNVALLRDALREVARAQQAAFFDPYALQGAGGLVRWYCATPSLASRDMVHMTDAGYRLLARALAAALDSPPTAPSDLPRR